MLEVCQFLWHLSVTSPQDAVATQYHGTDSQFWLYLQQGLLPAGVDNRQTLIASQPQFAVPDVHGADSFILNSIQQLVHVVQALAILPSVETLALVVGQPRDAAVVMIGHQRVGERGRGNGADHLYTRTDGYYC